MPDQARGKPDGPVLVTGAAGFAGRHLTAALHAHWPGLDVLTPDFDVRDSAEAARIMAGARPCCCVHLAAISSVPNVASDPDLAWQVNLHGTLTIARAIMAHAPSCQMLFVSSADAYGASFRGGQPVTEDAPLSPMTLYGATKAAADLALGVYATQGLHVVRLRAFNHVGPGQSADFALPNFARQIARIEAGLQEPVLETGRLDTWRDFLDVRDVCAAYIACIEQRAAITPGTVFNIASGHARRLGDVLQALIAAAGIAPRIAAAAPQWRATDIPHASGSAARVAAELGWYPRIPWQDTLASILDDWRHIVAA